MLLGFYPLEPPGPRATLRLRRGKAGAATAVSGQATVVGVRRIAAEGEARVRGIEVPIAATKTGTCC